MVHGQENRRAIAAHGLRHVMKKFRSTLTAQQTAEVDREPIIANLRTEYEAVRARHQPLLQQGDSSLERQVRLASERLQNARNAAFRRGAIELAMQRQDAYFSGRVRSLADAIKELQTNLLDDGEGDEGNQDAPAVIDEALDVIESDEEELVWGRHE